MQKYQIHTVLREILADDLTPVGIYQSLRDFYAISGIMESNDMRSVENCHSFVLVDPIATFLIKGDFSIAIYPDGRRVKTEITNPGEVNDHFQAFMAAFEIDGPASVSHLHGVFGFTNFEACQYFDAFQTKTEGLEEAIHMRYDMYRFVMSFNHLTDSLQICMNQLINEDRGLELELLIRRIRSRRIPKYPFSTIGEETSCTTDDRYIEMVNAGKYHCQRGDVFQLVLSRSFQQAFEGDEFNVYRALRSINPSPYLFYFSYDQFRMGGSSPEAQLIVSDRTAIMHPIAGTYKRTGDDTRDAILAKQLLEDPKENAEHVMLVDLARNDLGRFATQVEVKNLKDIHYYSHVIHLVSEVVGELPASTNPMSVFGATFPAGTLSGAPKIKAVELIKKYEETPRGFYGGSIGFIGFNGNVNTAILIRSFFSKDYVLNFRAGAGIVIDSVPENELAEVNNKIAAIRKAIDMAQTI